MYRQLSYTAAGEMPWKLLKHPNAVRDGHITPIHIQFVPTNRCNQKCSWCSCSKVERSLELDIGEIREILNEFSNLGTESMTITGGGEPTVHSNFGKILEHAISLNIKSGLVTNGMVIPRGKIPYDLLNQALTWVRISVYEPEGSYDTCLIEKICALLPDVDIGISFTVTDSANMNTAIRVSQLAERTPNITHIRFVQDILHANEEYLIKMMDMVRRNCKEITDKALFQYRNIFTRGTPQCYISLLKPTINADGYVYPCCGVQYASDELRTMPKKFRMCRWNEFKYTSSFNGSICKKCYYDKYNEVLSYLVMDMAHKEFV